jgi:hypothetical protein
VIGSEHILDDDPLRQRHAGVFEKVMRPPSVVFR